MKIVAAALLVALLLVPGVALAGSSTDAALALGAFAVFNQIISGVGVFGAAPVIAAPRPVIVAPAPVVVAPPPPVYAAPAPVYVPAPPVYVAPPPVYVAPPPVVVAPRPVFIAPRPVFVHSGHRFHRVHGHGGWDGHWHR